MTHYTVIGAGIVGLATAKALQEADPNATIVIVEKESRVAVHQTGHNSGVIHSGIYYKPGSQKALMCRAGAASMIEFAQQNGIGFEKTGKLIVATDTSEIPRMEAIHQRGLDNGIPVHRISAAEALDYEPHVSAVAALRVDSTAIVDFVGVCEVLLTQVQQHGADVRFNCPVTGMHHVNDTTVIQTPNGPIITDVVISCAGLQADRIAALDQPDGMSDYRVVPFRGEYFELAKDREHLVKGLIYPVPDPELPFLGVHLTKMVRGGVHAGPNAVLALAREGYDWKTIKPRDIAGSLAYPGFWRLARANVKTGFDEILRSVSRKRFAQSLARLVPEIGEHDIVASPAGVRAQLVKRDGSIVDDFMILQQGRNVHVLNAPSPAATASLEIGRHIAARAAGNVRV
ncbi:MAG: L-2-hydroxyglutarate oxidase [Antricoccus sp.]